MDAIIVATQASRYSHIYCHVLSGFLLGKFEARMMVMRIMTRERHRKMPRPNFCLAFIWDFWRTRMGMLMTVGRGEREGLVTLFPTSFFFLGVVSGDRINGDGKKEEGGRELYLLIMSVKISRMVATTFKYKRSSVCARH